MSSFKRSKLVHGNAVRGVNVTARGFATALGALALSSVIGMVSSSARAQDQTPPPPATPAAPAAAQAPAPPAAPIMTITGLVDGYYAYDFNKPARAIPGTPGTEGVPGTAPVFLGSGIIGPGTRNFDSKHDLLTLGLAEVSFAKAVAPTSRLGFLVRLAYGPTADLVASGGDINNKNILQAYASFLVPAGGRDITVDAGKFVTHMGQEVIEPSANWNFSRSYLFQYYIPYYHAGVRAAVPVSPTVTVTGFLVNGWNNVSFDTNGNKAVGAAIAINPSPATSILLNGLTSVEPAGLADKSKTTLEPILTHTFSPMLTGVIDVNYDFGKGTLLKSPSDAGSSWTAYGVAGYLHYTFKNTNALTLRGEYFDDTDGFLTAANGKQTGNEITVTYSLKSASFPNAETRFEFRHDSTKQPGLFEGSDGLTGSKKNQDTISLSELISF